MNNLVGLGKRAIKAGWEWMSGAVSLPDDKGRTWRRVGDGWAQESGKRLRCRVDADSLVPDFSDHATMGCLLKQVREAYQCPWLSAVGSATDGWRIDIDADPPSADVCDAVRLTAVVRRSTIEIHSFWSEEESLVSAWEVAE